MRPLPLKLDWLNMFGRGTLTESSRPKAGDGPSERLKGAPKVALSTADDNDFVAINARLFAGRASGVGEYRASYLGLPRCMDGDGAGGESQVEKDMDELNDSSTSAGRSISVRVGDNAGESSGELRRLMGNVSMRGEERAASIMLPIDVFG